MARRKNGKTLSFPRVASSDKPIETLALSDSERLLWERFIGPAEQALAATQRGLDNAAQILLESMLTARKLSQDDGWKFHMAKRRWERHPVGKED